MDSVKLFLLSILIGACRCYCPPLVAPMTTSLICEDPKHHQRLNCSSSWLAQSTIAQFRCKNASNKTIKGRIVCFEDGTHRHVGRKSKEGSGLPCGIRRETDKPEIHVYGYQTPTHYKLPKLDSKEGFRTFGEALHNEFRDNHGSPPLKLHPDLSSAAQKWADHAAHTGRLDMESNKPYGQNIFLAQTGNVLEAVNDAIRNWYKGRSEYCWEDVKENWENSLALEFSQLVWKNSKILGIGSAPFKSSKNKTVVVVFYDPPGNVVVSDDTEKSEIEFKSNVLPSHTKL